MKEDERIVALILAAGFSSRMETFKPLLPVGGAPLIERTIARFLQAGFDDVRVIVGHRAKEVIPIATRYLADKLVDGVRRVSLEARFLGSRKRYPGNADIAEAIRRRFATASMIKTRIERILEAPVEAAHGGSGRRGK